MAGDEHGAAVIPQQHALDVNEQILSLSAAGRYVGVLTADRLDVYNQSLESYSTLDGTQGAQSVLLRDDGSAMLLSLIHI